MNPAIFQRADLDDVIYQTDGRFLSMNPAISSFRAVSRLVAAVTVPAVLLILPTACGPASGPTRAAVRDAAASVPLVVEPPDFRWMWYPEGDPRVFAPSDPRYFRRTLELDQAPARAILWVAADNLYEAYVNGEKIGGGHDFTRPERYDVTEHLRPGANALAIQAQNQGGPAGLFVVLTRIDPSGRVEHLVGGPDWKTSTAKTDGWTRPGFDDSPWKPALVLEEPVPAPWKPAEREAGRIAALRLSSPAFSPNGDEFRDTLALALHHAFAATPDIRATLRIQDPRGRTVARFHATRAETETFVWGGRDLDGRRVPDGEYLCVVEIETPAGRLHLEDTIRVDTRIQFRKAPNTMKHLFPIGVWFDGRVHGINVPEGYHNVPAGLDNAAKYYEENFRDMLAHNLEIVVIPNTPPEYRETLLTVADRLGIRVVLELVELAYPEFGGRFSVRHPEMEQGEAEVLQYVRELIEPLRKHPSLLAYQVLDEPPEHLFGNYNLISRALEHLDPERPSFTCLCFEHELDRTAALGTQMIIFDRYPLSQGTAPGGYDFRHFTPLLDNLNRHAGEKPYWMVLQTFAMDRPGMARYPTAAEVRVMTWLSLARNAKGIFYFLHNSMTQDERMLGLVDLEMNPHPIYAEVAALAKHLRRLAPTVLAIQPVATPLVEPVEGFDVRSFRDAQGRGYVFVVNYDMLEERAFTGTLTEIGVARGAKADAPNSAATDAATPHRLPKLRNVLTHEPLPLAAGSDGNAREARDAAATPALAPAFTLSLAPGEGALLAFLP